MDHVERRHSIVLSGSIACVFLLFTPAGEKLWVEGWDPEFLHPTSGETCEGRCSEPDTVAKSRFGPASTGAHPRIAFAMRA